MAILSLRYKLVAKRPLIIFPIARLEISRNADDWYHDLSYKERLTDTAPVCAVNLQIIRLTGIRVS